MTLKDKLEIGLKEDAQFRKDNLPEMQIRGPEIPAGEGRSPEIPMARGDRNIVESEPDQVESEPDQVESEPDQKAQQKLRRPRGPRPSTRKQGSRRTVR